MPSASTSWVLELQECAPIQLEFYIFLPSYRENLFNKLSFYMLIKACLTILEWQVLMADVLIHSITSNPPSLSSVFVCVCVCVCVCVRHMSVCWCTKRLELHCIPSGAVRLKFWTQALSQSGSHHSGPTGLCLDGSCHHQCLSSVTKCRHSVIRREFNNASKLSLPRLG